MTPRALVKGTGLRGPGQDIFPEAAKQEARNIALVEEAAQVFRNTPTDDGGGDVHDKWQPLGNKVAGRIDSVGRKGAEQLFGEQIDEATSHVVTLEPGVDVTPDDRVEIEGIMWTITGQAIFTEAASTRLPVRELQT